MSRKWKRACTTRLYVQPPRSERLYTFWREGKFCFGENENPITDYLAQTSSAIWFVDGDGDQLDFRDAEYVMQPDGIPVHGLRNSVGSLNVEFETFATFERLCTGYIKLTLTNKSDSAISDKFGFVLRTAQEKQLLFDSPDNYGFYAPKLAYWMDIPATWKQNGTTFNDGERTIKTCGDLSFKLDESTGFAFADVELKANESVSAIFAYNIGDFELGDYDAECAKVIDSWEKELLRINKLPAKIASNPEQAKLIKNLVVHILQMFCYSKGNNYLLSRQGGLQRQIWTGEANAVFPPLARIGDFTDYIDDAIDTYFNVFWTETGEVVPFGIWWAMQTGNVLFSFANYALVRGKEYFYKYYEKAVKSFEWIRDMRASAVADGKRIVAGLFPPLSSSDDELIFQNWGMTDCSNINSLREFLKACKQFDAPISAEVEAEVNDYVSVVQKYWDIRVKENEGSDELRGYYAPIGDNEKFEETFLFNPGTYSLMNILDVDVETFERYNTYRRRRGGQIGGMYNRMLGGIGPRGSLKHSFNAVGKCVVWYVCCTEIGIFRYYLRHNKKDKCEEIIRDAISYAMTDELYMIERFHEDNPYFIPWSPNASANGRLIEMLLDFYAD